jgi:hypothetical protein
MEITMRAMLRRLRTRLQKQLDKRRPRLQLQVENLESRTLLSASSLEGLFATPASLHHPLVTNPSPSGYTPDQIRHAYGFDQITFNNGAIAGDGSGQTIAIVDAYNDPTLSSDLRTFDQMFNLPDPVLTKVQEYVYGRAPRNDAGWALETSLDVEWAHAAAPGADILLVETASASYNDLLSAVDYARNYDGVSVVSMSWGGGEFASETGYDGHFTTPANHGGVTFVASSGDTGGNVEYPAVSPNVVAVGGTTLHLASDNTISSETAWSGSDGGVSSYESKPSYQAGISWTGARSSPDVALNADTATGYAVYDSYGYSGQNGWFTLGGTSAGAPQWAGLVAIANQGRAVAGNSSLDGATETLPALYSMPDTNFHDITTGTSSNGRNSAGTGYDLMTGRGTPVAGQVVQSLSGVPVSAPVGSHTVTSSTSSTQTNHAVQGAKNHTGGPTARPAFILATDPAQLIVGNFAIPVSSLSGTVPLPSFVTPPNDRVTAPVNQELQQGPSAAAGLIASIRNAAGYKTASGREAVIRGADDQDDAQERRAAPRANPTGDAAAGHYQILPAAVIDHLAAEGDGYFMPETPLELGTSSSWSVDEQGSPLTWTASRLAALMVVLSGYWSVSRTDPDERLRRVAVAKR